MEWESLEIALREMDLSIVIDDIAEEIAAAKNESENHTIINELELAISNTRIVGEIGYLDTSKVDLVKLSQAISLASRLGCKTENAEKAKATAEFALKVRESIVDSKWDVARDLLESFKDLNLSTIISEEIQLLLDEMDNRTIILELATAVSHGCIMGVPGNIDVTEVDAAVVSQAIATVEEIGCKSIDASEMLETAKIIFQLRTLVLDKKWTEIYDFINTRVYESKFQPHAFAVEEIDLAQSEAVDVSVTYH